MKKIIFLCIFLFANLNVQARESFHGLVFDIRNAIEKEELFSLECYFRYFSKDQNFLSYSNFLSETYLYGEDANMIRSYSDHIFPSAKYDKKKYLNKISKVSCEKNLEKLTNNKNYYFGFDKTQWEKVEKLYLAFQESVREKERIKIEVEKLKYYAFDDLVDDRIATFSKPVIVSTFALDKRKKIEGKDYISKELKWATLEGFQFAYLSDDIFEATKVLAYENRQALMKVGCDKQKPISDGRGSKSFYPASILGDRVAELVLYLHGGTFCEVRVYVGIGAYQDKRVFYKSNEGIEPTDFFELSAWLYATAGIRILDKGSSIELKVANEP